MTTLQSLANLERRYLVVSLAQYIIPRLQTVLRENIPSDRLALRRRVEELISIAPNLKKLSLSLSHMDLNATNLNRSS